MISSLRKPAGIPYKVRAESIRRRFITILVAAQLKAYVEATPPMSPGTILSILFRVPVISGHSDPKSLYPYVELALQRLESEGVSQSCRGAPDSKEIHSNQVDF